jgi:hypothetical protein
VCSVTNSAVGKKAQDRYVARVSYGAQTRNERSRGLLLAGEVMGSSTEGTLAQV